MAALLILINLVSACATSPTRLDINNILTASHAYHNRRVELTGNVIDYEPAAGDTYRTFQFTLGIGPEEKIRVSGSGYTADAIAKASDLVWEALVAREPLTVVGTIEADEGVPPELRLESVEYEGRRIDVTRGRNARRGLGGFRIVPSFGLNITIVD